MQELTQEYLKECFTYNPETGDLTWKERPLHHFKSIKNQKIFNSRQAGEIAGSKACLNKIHYKVTNLTSIRKSPYLVHRLIWTLIYGEIPNIIDHIDGDGSNNRLENLRNGTRRDNQKNQKMNIDNKSGCMGIYWYEPLKKWQVNIRHNDKNNHLGYFKDWFEAVCTRKSAENKHGYHINHGRSN
jgi:hypothetical protein